MYRKEENEKYKANTNVIRTTIRKEVAQSKMSKT